MYINRFFFVSFEPYKRGSASVQTTKPVQEPKLGSSLAVPVGNPNENPNFNQVVPVLVQGNALKRLKTLGRAVSVIEMAPPFQLVSAAGSLLDPSLKPGRGVFVFVPLN